MAVTEKKFIKSWNISDYEILTDEGFVDVVSLHKTVPYQIYIVETEDGHRIECADNHIVFTEGYQEIYVKDLCAGMQIHTEDGLSHVRHVTPINDEQNMYDFELPENSNHRYYTNGILSHNTMLVKTIAKMLDVPVAICDSTTFTQAGYVGEDVESMLTRLYQSAGNDIEKTQKGIIVLDEIDKIARKGDSSVNRDVSGEGVQHALLKMLEGSKVKISPNGNKKNPDKDMIEIDTKNILFICSGAFVGIDKIISSRVNSRSVGFAKNGKKQFNKDKVLDYLTSDDVQSYGMIPELVGRIPIIMHTNTLDRAMLKRILTEPKNSIIKQYTKLFELDNVKLTFDDDALDYIVDKSIEMKLNARGLRAILEEVMSEYMYDIPSGRKKKLNVTREYAQMMFDRKLEFAGEEQDEQVIANK